MKLSDSLGGLRGRFESIGHRFRDAFDNLNERERRLVALLGIILATIAVLLPLYLLKTAVWELEDRKESITQVLKEVRRDPTKLRALQAERQALKRRYSTPPPPLGSFIESKAREQGLAVREVSDEPEKVVSGYTRQQVKVKLSDVGLQALMGLLTSIENSPYPVAVSRLKVEHYQAGDKYNVELGIMAFRRRGGDS